MTGRVIVGLLWVTILVVVGQAWSVGTSRARLSAAAPPVTGMGHGPGDATISDAYAADAEPTSRLDLYGYEIDDAVSDYRLDVRGDVYERHSPDTEVTHLAAPST